MNCRPLSVIIVFEIRNRHTILHHKKACTFFTEMDVNGLA